MTEDVNQECACGYSLVHGITYKCRSMAWWVEAVSEESHGVFCFVDLVKAYARVCYRGKGIAVYQ